MRVLGGDGGYNEPYIINPYKEDRCACCGRMEELRMGICWDCATCETVIGEGIDMHDKPIPQLAGYSKSMAKLKYILDRYLIKCNSEHRNKEQKNGN